MVSSFLFSLLRFSLLLSLSLSLSLSSFFFFLSFDRWRRLRKSPGFFAAPENEEYLPLNDFLSVSLLQEIFVFKKYERRILYTLMFV